MPFNQNRHTSTGGGFELRHYDEENREKNTRSAKILEAKNVSNNDHQ